MHRRGDDPLFIFNYFLVEVTTHYLFLIIFWQTFTYKMIKKIYLLHANEKKIWLKYTCLFMHSSSFFFYFFLKPVVMMVQVCHFSDYFQNFKFIFRTILFFQNIISLFNNIIFFIWQCSNSMLHRFWLPW
jgi:hypothetical protein